MSFDEARFIQAVGDRTGLDPDAAQTAVTATCEALGRALRPAAADPVATLLPEPLAEAVRAGARTGPAASFLTDLAAHEQVSVGFAREHAQVVLEQIAGLFDAPTQALLRERVADRVPEAASWLVPWQPPSERSPRPAQGWDRTLASGRPGSETPLSEARPPAGHSDSPAVTADPHADTRLSSSEGTAAERRHSTLAEGRPGSGRPVSEGHE